MLRLCTLNCQPKKRLSLKLTTDVDARPANRYQVAGGDPQRGGGGAPGPGETKGTYWRAPGGQARRANCECVPGCGFRRPLRADLTSIEDIRARHVRTSPERSAARSARIAPLLTFFTVVSGAGEGAAA